MGRDVGSGGKGEETSGYGDDSGESGDEDDNGGYRSKAQRMRMKLRTRVKGRG